MRYIKFFAPLQGDTGDLLVAEKTQKEKMVIPEKPVQEYTSRELVALVTEAAELVSTMGEAAFNEFRLPGSRWQQDETYIFVLDTVGNMIVHPDPELQGKNQLELKDINGKPIIRGLLGAATNIPNKPEGWYHYQWPVPGGLLPRWKSSYVRLVKAPSGKSFIIGSGMYNDSMEKEFVVDLVKEAVALIEKNYTEAFRLFHDPKGPFLVKDCYIFVYEMDGTSIVVPAFPNLEGTKLINMRDTNGKQHIREMLELVQSKDSGWVDYMLPKPGESISTQKTAYVTKARIGDRWVMVGCGIYLAETPRQTTEAKKITAPELMTLVREGATLLQEQGEKAYTEFRKKESKWFQKDTYLFVFSMEGTRVFHAAEPETEGRNDIELKDIVGRPFIRMFIDAVSTPSGEGWVHYMWPLPGDYFPTWKSSFVKQVTYPSGKQYFIGSGIYNMQMDRSFIEDVVNRAAALLTKLGRKAFDQLRDKTGPFVFMDTYVFVDSPDGVELVNPALPSIEGKNLLYLRDAHGQLSARNYIDAAMNNDSAWVDYYWYRPGKNTPAHKFTYVRKVQSGGETFVLGAGYYVDEDTEK